MDWKQPCRGRLASRITPDNHRCSRKPMEYKSAGRYLYWRGSFWRQRIRCTSLRIGWCIQRSTEKWNDHISQYPFFTVDAGKSPYLGRHKWTHGRFTVCFHFPGNSFRRKFGYIDTLDDLRTPTGRRKTTLAKSRKSLCRRNIRTRESETTVWAA